MLVRIEDLFDLEKEAQLSQLLPEESLFCFRAKRRAVRLADALLDEEGNLQNIEELLSLLKNQGYILAFHSYNDGELNEHFLKILQVLKSSPSLVQKLSGFALPLCSRELEEMVAITLEEEGAISNRHVIWAVLSALLCPLRQSIGSCFSTAPAILVHEEQMHLFLEDMQSLFVKGCLSRTFGGVESVVPISPSPGMGDWNRPYQKDHPGFVKAVHSVGLSEKRGRGTYLQILEEFLLKKFGLKKKDLKLTRQSPKLEKVGEMRDAMRRAKWEMVGFTDHLLLKVWEFTLASFVDVKTEFSSWNLFSSLGLHAEEKGGIGELVYTYLEQKLREANENLDRYQTDYEIAFDQVRLAECLLKNASTESEIRRLRAEHQARLYHMQACLDTRDKFHLRGQNIASFFSFFIEQITTQAQSFFQEVYDAEMHDVQTESYDDSPAGFRLLYKHGRAHVGSWTFIYRKEEYIQALKDFFVAIEHPMTELCEWEEGKQEISHLITAIIHRVSDDEFLLLAFYRMAKAHRVPLKKLSLDELDKMEKKPWAYTSGGTLETLLKTYFCREGSLTEEARWVESSQDLLIFILETLKQLPPLTMDPFIENPEKRMLIASPTHVFSLLPGEELFRRGWEDSGFTYTWVRDQIVLPARNFYASIRLNSQEQLFLLQELAITLPPVEANELQRRFILSEEPLSIQAFVKKLPSLPHLSAFLFEMLPLSISEKGGRLIGRRTLHDQMIASESICQSRDRHEEIAHLMRAKGLAPPKALIFADTNWAKYLFAFLVNPVSEKLELWRTDRIGLTGAPMHNWEPFLNGSIKQSWRIFSRPHEYMTRER